MTREQQIANREEASKLFRVWQEAMHKACKAVQANDRATADIQFDEAVKAYDNGKKLGYVFKACGSRARHYSMVSMSDKQLAKLK